MPGPAAPLAELDPPLRSWRERVLQTLAFEVAGLVAVTPVASLLSGSSLPDSALLLVCLSIAVMSWMAAYNTAFDIAEVRLAQRAASDRPHRWRLVHAVGLEVTSVLVTTPLIVALTSLGWIEALAVDIGLGLAYAAYGYVFHLCFDRLRPVRSRTRSKAG